MSKRLAQFFGVLWMLIFLAACGPSQAQLDQQATQTTVELHQQATLTQAELDRQATAAAPTPIPGIETPVEVDGTTIQVISIRTGKFLGSQVVKTKEEMGAFGGYEAKAGFTFVQVNIQVLSGASVQAVSEWEASLLDAQGEQYNANSKGWGIGFGGSDMAGWVFAVPENETSLWLSLPGGVKIDLSTLLET